MGAFSEVVESVGDFVGDTVSGIGDTVTSFVEDPIEFTGNVLENALDDPLKTAAIVAGSYFAPELLGELAPEALATEVAAPELLPVGWGSNIIPDVMAAETGLATLPESVLAADAAFGTGAGSLATDAALAAGAGASGTAAADMAISGLGEVPWESLGDQAGDFPLEGSYGNPLASGVQDAAQNLLDNNALQQISGAIPSTLGDQTGDYPLEGNYGNPLADGVQEATKNLLDYNANYATPSLWDSLSNLTSGVGKGLTSGNTSSQMLPYV